MKDLKVGDSIFSKNNTEFNCTVKAIKGSKVTVEYVDEYEETQIVDKSCLTYMSDGEYEAANRTFQFDQL